MRIFVISLSDDTNRRQKVQKTLSDLQIEFEFFDAIDARCGVPEKYVSFIDRNSAENRLHRAITDVEIGCSLSHALLYKKIADENIAHAIILEDDFICNTDFQQALQNKILQNHPCGFILLYHYRTVIYKFKIKHLWKKYRIAPLKQCNGAVGYYMDIHTAKNLADKVFPISYVADWPCDLHHYNAHAITPRIIQHPALNDNISTMEQYRKDIQFKITPKRWIIQQIKRLFIPLIHIRNKIFLKRIADKVDGD